MAAGFDERIRELRDSCALRAVKAHRRIVGHREIRAERSFLAQGNLPRMNKRSSCQRIASSLAAEGDSSDIPLQVITVPNRNDQTLFVGSQLVCSYSPDLAGCAVVFMMMLRRTDRQGFLFRVSCILANVSDLAFLACQITAETETQSATPRRSYEHLGFHALEVFARSPKTFCRSLGLGLDLCG